jgi:uncharacterized protein YeaO (DUF488 family)
MLTVYTAQYRYSGNNRLDITVKGQDPIGKHFAPTWDMVMGYKNGSVSKKEYIVQYLNILKKVDKSIWENILNRDEVVLVCFCSSKDFCHRKVLAKVLERKGAIYTGEV